MCFSLQVEVKVLRRGKEIVTINVKLEGQVPAPRYDPYED